MSRSIARRVALSAGALLFATAGVAHAEPSVDDTAAEASASAEATPAAPSPQVPANPVELRQAAFADFTLTSPATLDMVGVQPSLYRGKYFRTSIESRRLCIVKRESEGHYFSVNHSGRYRGAYQVSKALAKGATWMMLPEHEKLMGAPAAQATMAKLRATPFNAWPRYWQDALFSTVANWGHTGAGLKHWAGGRWHC
jgi:hypothetical protein